ncbi:Telomere end binding protein [Penicillium bovifimosum]|uniref:Telomere end binding protein n=1 Tax=Penicillium bovifimosum TaxID=126998 RepID=A0A9W9LC20_9EURO|nr:Telomere end binding protein [Penicillium bovifimosum]KAJ5146423.1 Telomere end binding protein [Penicillium bovifimosum]
MDATESPATNAFAHLTKVPIAQLSPDLENSAQKFFLAAVALVWPYSSSAKCVSLLLVESDVRLRRDKGQIKVTFHGHIAEKIAESHIGIGDTVRLALKGSKFVNSEGIPQTPGRSVAWDAHFEDGVSLEVPAPHSYIHPRSSDTTLTISVAPQATAPHETQIAPPTTPARNPINPGLDLASSAGSWSSPAFLKPTRTSFGATTHSAFDPFAEEDGFVPGKGRKRPRYSLQRDDWQVLTGPEIPEEQETPVDWEKALDQAIDRELAEAEATSEPSDELMAEPEEPPTYMEDASEEPATEFAKPSLELTDSILERRAGGSHDVSSHEQVDIHGISSQLPTDTPQLRPVPSPGLPVPSPLISSHTGSADYFPPWAASYQAQDTQSVPTEVDNIASPPESTFEAQDTEVVHYTSTEVAQSADPDVGPIEQEHVLDAGFLLRTDAASPSSSTGSLVGHEIESIDDTEAVDESGIAQADVAVEITVDEAQVPDEEWQERTSDDVVLPHGRLDAGSVAADSLDDQVEVLEGSATAQTDIGTESGTERADHQAQISNERPHEDLVNEITSNRDQSEPALGSGDEPTVSPEVIAEPAAAQVADIGMEDAGNTYPVSEELQQANVLLSRERSILSTHSDDESAEVSDGIEEINVAQSSVSIGAASDNARSSRGPSEIGDNENRAPVLQSGDLPPPPAAFDQDAIDALEMMIATRDEELEKKRNMGASTTNEGDIEGSLLAEGTIDPAPTQGYSEEEDEVLEDEEEYEESPGDYESRYDYDEDRQDDVSVDESGDDESEPQRNLDSRTGAHDVIVLDSDSDDEPVSNHPAAPTSQSPDSELRSYHFEPAYPADVEMSRQESPGPWYVDGVSDNHRAAEEESDSDESHESEESEEPDYNEQDGRVYESDIESDVYSDAEGESAGELYETGPVSRTPPLGPDRQDEEEVVADAELIEETEHVESASATSPDSQVQVSVDRESGGEPPSNIDPSLFDTVEGQHEIQPASVEVPGRQVSPSGSEGASTSPDSGRQFEPHISPSVANDVADSPSTEPTIEGPAPLGGLPSWSSIMPQSEGQLLTPDPTQENAFPREQRDDSEPNITFVAEENEPSPGLGVVLPSTGSLEIEGDNSLEAETVEIAEQMPRHEHDEASTLSDVVQPAMLPTTPRRSSSADVLVSTETPKTPALVITQAPGPDRHAAGLRSKLSYFAPLATLFDHYNALVDTVSIVHEASPINRAKSGSKDWFVTIDLTDPSLAGTTIRAQIFRRYKSAIPSLTQGVAILLRDFKVRSLNHTAMLVSVESSAWAVFDGSSLDVEVNGPPVEFDSQERAFASGLRRWYSEAGSGWIADHMLQASIERDSLEPDLDLTPSSRAASESSTPDSKRGSHRKRRAHQRVAIHELRDGTRYTDAGSPNSRNSSVHELRDGTLYANL